MSVGTAGVGFSENQDSLEAGRQAAAEALERAGHGPAGLVLAFCTGKHDYEACFAGIRSVTGNAAPVVGGAALGIITNDRLGYEGHEVGVAVLPAGLDFRTAASGALDDDETRTGIDLGAQLKRVRRPDDELLLLFYDSIKKPPPPAPVLNVSTLLLDGLLQTIGEAPPPIVGAGLVGDYAFSPVRLFCGGSVADQHAVGVLMSGNCTAFQTIMHGCKPISDYHTITRVEGTIVYEIDGKPAARVIDELLGTQEWQKRMPLLTVTLGVNYGDKYAPFNEDSYVNRLIVGHLPEQEALVLFEADCDDGTEFQFMQRSSHLMLQSAEARCEGAMARIAREKVRPILALYIDCAGRTSAFSISDVEEASVVQRILGDDIPLLGFYSGVEIAPLLGRSRGLDWTGVLLVIATGS
ncbi:FIST signal transduction protein [Planctomycetota bacterium]